MHADELQEAVRECLAGHDEVLEAYLFGSRARGETAGHSDIDIAVYVNRSRARTGGFGYEAELGAQRMSCLGTNAVDVVVLNDAPPLLHHRVLRDGRRVLSRDLRATTAREGRALSRYCDYVPHPGEGAASDATASGRSRPLSPGALDETVARRHLVALREAVDELRRHY
ncbi:MAG: type VII toxin-antitoxin system MntA family adenylyltransferase antitoxin [Polyangiales bacterium]